MTGVITWQRFESVARKLLQNGVKVCPCCLHDHIEFSTTDDHRTYILECAACHIGIQASLMFQIRERWNRRYIKDERINKITHNITCDYLDTDADMIRSVCLETNQKEEQNT